MVENIGEPVRDKLHDTLLGGCEPEVALIVSGNIFDVGIHRDILESLGFCTVFFEYEDAFSCTYPEVPVDDLHAVDAAVVFNRQFLVFGESIG